MHASHSENQKVLADLPFFRENGQDVKAFRFIVKDVLVVLSIIKILNGSFGQIKFEGDSSAVYEFLNEPNFFADLPKTMHTPNIESSQCLFLINLGLAVAAHLSSF